MKKLLMFAAVFSLAAFAATAQANLLDDGSFELSTSGSQISNSAWTVTTSDANDPTEGGIFTDGAWAVKDGARGFWYQSFQGDPNGAAVDLDLAQGVLAPLSGDYILTFWSAREPNVAATSILASLSSSGTGGTDSLELLTATYDDGLNFADGPGTQFSLFLTGVTAGDLLTVSTAMVGGVNSTVNPQSLMVDSYDLIFIPEPTSIALAGLGLLGAFSMRRKR
jgi:hypothetical protein